MSLIFRNPLVSWNIVTLRHSTKRLVVTTTAAYNPSWGPVPSQPSSLHGVLHSSDLPPALVDSVGVYDARDAIEACSGLWGEDKEACYAIFGVDPEAELWFDVVFQLENSLELETGALDVLNLFENACFVYSCGFLFVMMCCRSRGASLSPGNRAVLSAPVQL